MGLLDVTESVALVLVRVLTVETLCGLAPVWTFMWQARLSLPRKIFLHVGHGNGFLRFGS